MVNSIGQQGQAGAYFSAALGGCLRIPALIISANAVAMAGELVVRGLTTTLALAGIKVDNQDSVINKAVAILEKNNINFRPYKDLPIKTLVVSTVACAAIGILGTEFANLIFGPTPGIYNHVMKYFTPFRIDSTSWAINVGLR